MADDDAGEIIGGILMLFIIVIAVIAAVMMVIVLGSIVGTGVGLVNYCRALYANVRPERPAVT